MSLSDHGPVATPRLEPSPSDRPRIAIISNVLLYREGLAASLARDGRLDIAATMCAAEAPGAVGGLDLDAILIDSSTEGALALARRMRAICPDVRLVGFGIAGGADEVLACAEAGVTAFVDSNGTVQELVGAVESALRGELLCSPRVTALLCDRLASLAGNPNELTEPLTRREREIAALIAEGLSNKEIASDLKIGPATVKNHVHNILEKLKVRRRAAVAALWRELAPAIPSGRSIGGIGLRLRTGAGFGPGEERAGRAPLSADRHRIRSSRPVGI
jgi:DNA-binding NarL/FixJ family response regulator